jgi:DNA-binding NtrC family response regulator
VIVISGPEDSMDAAQCLREGAVSWLSKPFSPSNACVMVCQAIEKNALKAKCRAAGQIRTS